MTPRRLAAIAATTLTVGAVLRTRHRPVGTSPRRPTDRVRPATSGRMAPVEDTPEAHTPAEHRDPPRGAAAADVARAEPERVAEDERIDAGEPGAAAPSVDNPGVIRVVNRAAVAVTLMSLVAMVVLGTTALVGSAEQASQALAALPSEVGGDEAGQGGTALQEASAEADDLPAGDRPDLLTAVPGRSRPAPDGATDALTPRVQRAAPARVLIPAIGVDAAVDRLGTTDGVLDVPEDFARTGWWAGGPEPGEVGRAVVVGHVDSFRGPAVFHGLRDLQPGDEVVVQRVDGSEAVFAVTSSLSVRKDTFPTQHVYGPDDEPALRLITCGGDFADGSYLGNLVVSAALVAERPVSTGT